MNILNLWSKPSTHTTCYTKGQITTSEQAKAAREVQSIEQQLDSAAIAFKQIQNTSNNLNGPGSQTVYGTIALKDKYGSTELKEGSCRFNEQGQLESLNLGDGQFTFEKHGEHTEIHRQSETEASGSGGVETTVVTQWIVSDGPRVKYSEQTRRHSY